MGPADVSDMSSTTAGNSQVLSLPKLQGDSSNWATYNERIMNYLTSKGLRRHILGTARKPEKLMDRDGSFYKQATLAPLTDEELEKHEEAQDTYDQMQAAVRVEQACVPQQLATLTREAGHCSRWQTQRVQATGSWQVHSGMTNVPCRGG